MHRKLLWVVGMSLLLGVWIVPAQADLQDGLVSYFKMDEGGGTFAADSSGNGNHGTLIGETLEWVPGYDGGALGCSVPVDAEVEDRLEFPTTGMSTAAGTVSVWASLADPQPSTRGRYIFGHTAQPQWNSRIQIYMQDGSEPSRLLDIGLGSGGTGHALETDIMEMPLNEWTHVALTWANGGFVVYVNSEKVADGTHPEMTLPLAPVANFGNDGSNAPYEAFCGMLDEGRVYNRAISAAEVKEIFELPAAPRVKAWGPDPVDGARDVTMPLFKWKSLDSIVMHDVYVGTDPNLTEADLAGPRQPLELFYYAGGLEAGVTYYWRVDEIEADMVTVHTGDVWSFLAQPLTAYDPVPADGSNTAGLAPNLTWTAGKPPVQTHHLYFADTLAAVEEGAADADQGELADPNFAPGALDPLTTYYWRVDEVGAGNAVQTGPVWNFTTALTVDDMESYTDEEGSRIYETWIDGWTNDTGSTVGYIQAPFAEQTIVHGDSGQSMPLDYNNVNAPFYSEAEQEFSSTRDWTANGVDTLVLYVRTLAGSEAAPLYVELKDSSNKTGLVSADASMVSAADWTEWKIPLSEFAAAGVNLARIKTIYIGVGDKANPTAGGAGVLFVDDISLAKPAPAAQ